MITPAEIIEMTDKHEKGRALEELSERLLTIEFGAVHITTPTPDNGIDRLGELADGTFVALQAKAYDGRTVSKAEWQSFIEEVRRINRLDGKRITRAVMFSTARVGGSPKAQASIEGLRDNGVAVSEWYRANLLDPIHSHLWEENTPRAEPLTPRKHQAKAIAAGKKFGKRGIINMATGTGKTLVATALLKHYGGLCVVTVPNMELVRQITRSFSRDAPGIDLLAVFSGQDVRLGLNITVPATTDPDVIKNFASGEGTRVIVTTYQSSGKVSIGLKGMTVNFAVMDEAHRTVGGASKSDKGGFQVCMKDSGIKIKKRLFMTATPKRHSLKAKKDAEAESCLLYSMDEVEQYGKVLYTLTPGQAIKDGLLAPFDVVAGLFRHSRAMQYLKTDAKKYARDIEGKHTIEDSMSAAFLLISAQEEKLGRNLVFVGSIKRAGLVAAALHDVSALLGVKAYAHAIDFESSTAKREEALGDLKKGRHGYDYVFVIQVDLFTEGVDIPALDGVVFVDSRKSVIAIAQAVGRALRLDPDRPDKRAKVILPVMITEKEDIEKVIEKSAFKPIRDYTIAILEAGFAPEQVVPVAKETGADSLGDAWWGEDDSEFVKWADSDLKTNQTCIETILLGGHENWSLPGKFQQVLNLLGHTLVSAPPVLTKYSNVRVKCKNGHVCDTSVVCLSNAVRAGQTGCEQCSFVRHTLLRVEEMAETLGATVLSAPPAPVQSSKITVKCCKGHTYVTTPGRMFQAIKFGRRGCAECSGHKDWTPERAGLELLKIGLTVVDMPDVVTAKSELAVICQNGHTMVVRNITRLVKLYDVGCCVCRGVGVPVTTERIRDAMSKVGLTTVGVPFKHGNMWKVLVRCSKGHEATKLYGTGKIGGCKKCADMKRRIDPVECYGAQTEAESCANQK